MTEVVATRPRGRSAPEGRVPQKASASPSRTIRRLVHRRLRRGALSIGAASAVTVGVSFVGYRRAYDTVAEREELVRSMTGNEGVVALFGAPHGIDQVGGFVAWRSVGILAVIAAVWAIVAVAGALRGSEDEGTWDLLVAGSTTKARATASALAGVATVSSYVFAPILLVTWLVGVRPGDVTLADGVLLAATVTAAPLLFGSVAALASQVAPSRSRAVGLASGVLGVAFAVRVVADGFTAISWIRWLSPLGWLLEVRPMADARPAVLVLAAASILVTTVATLVLARRRDVGESLRAERPPRSRRAALGLWSLTALLVRGSSLAWLALAAVAALVFGVVSGGLDSTPLPGFGGSRGPDAYLGTMFLLLSAVLALASASVLTHLRREESSGRLDNLLVRPVARLRWLTTWGIAAVVTVVAAGVVMGLAAWTGNRMGGGDAGLVDLVLAGLNATAPALLVLGLGIAVFGLRPRATATFAYSFVAGSFLVEMLGAVLDLPEAVVGLSVFHHLARLPQGEPDWLAWATVVAIGVGGAVVGAARLRRRDLAPA